MSLWDILGWAVVSMLLATGLGLMVEPRSDWAVTILYLGIYGAGLFIIPKIRRDND